METINLSQPWEGECFHKTNELRFVERTVSTRNNDCMSITVRVLQQASWGDKTGSVRWEDVPLVKED